MAAYNDILDNPIVTELEKNTAYVIKEIKKIP
jgi:hypothetical protein